MYKYTRAAFSPRLEIDESIQTYSHILSNNKDYQQAKVKLVSTLPNNYNTQPHATVSMDPSTFIFDEDIMSICPGQLLAGNVLYAAMSQLVASRPGSVVLNPEMVRHTDPRIKNMCKDARAQLQAIVSSVSGGDGQVFIPIIYNGHYTLAVVRHSNMSVRYYDSSPKLGISSPGARQIVTRFLPQNQNGKPWTHTILKCFSQLNGQDCGVAVFLNTMHILQNPDIQDITNMLLMPKDSQPLYYLAGRLAILEYCRLVAPEPQPLSIVEKGLEQAQMRIQNAKGSAKTIGDQVQAQSQVYSAFLSLLSSDISNNLLKTITDALGAMNSRWDRIIYP